MNPPVARPAGPALPPRWVMIVGSVLICAHLLAICVNVLTAPSGPWPTMEGADMSMPPLLFGRIHEYYSLPYLRALQMTHNYHFRTNRGAVPEAILEAKLLDREDREIRTVRLPDPKAPWAVRQRQAALVRWLTDDIPHQLPMGEKIAAPGKEVPRIAIWDPVPNEMRKLTLNRIPENEVPRDRPMIFKPSPWSLLVLRAIGRQLCRANEASAVELTRLSREPVTPRIFEGREAPPDMDDLASYYGRFDLKDLTNQSTTR
jgi:hypothetical protein